MTLEKISHLDHSGGIFYQEILVAMDKQTLLDKLRIVYATPSSPYGIC